MNRAELETAELRETIADLRRTIAWMDLALSRLSEGLIVVDEDEFRIAYCNDAFASMAGKPRIFLLGSPVGRYLPALMTPSASVRSSPATIAGEVVTPAGPKKVVIEYARLLFGRQALLVVREFRA